MRNLLHRKCKDIDICGICNSRLRKFCRSLGIKLDFVNSEEHIYDEIDYKNRKIKIAKLENVLYYKYQMQKKINSDLHLIGVKHYKDIVNVFYNLGEDKSRKLIDSMNLPQEDKDELLKWMTVGINNNKEI